jgi:uncharacterized protein (TIGR02145 family)
MKAKIVLTTVAIAMLIISQGQNPFLEFSFSGIEGITNVELDSIKVINRSQGSDTVLIWPDTVLIVEDHSAISEMSDLGEGLHVFQNHPNPVKDQTTIDLYLPDKGNVNLVITDILGRRLLNVEYCLDKGGHSFLFNPAQGEIFIFTAHWRSFSKSIKILAQDYSSVHTCTFEYIGNNQLNPPINELKYTDDFIINPGDTILFIGYHNMLQSGKLSVPEVSSTITFQFASNIPCPGTPTVMYEEQVYNTVQIFSQCWLKENLNVGTQIPGNQDMTDNDVIEKYCYNNQEDMCIEYGGLYQWNEIMQYNTLQGSRGICPPGWHIPTDEEWKVLEGAVDSQYGIADPEWDNWEGRGFDVGLNLKSTSGWDGGNNGTDLYGYSALPGGYLYENYAFLSLGDRNYIWSSTEFENEGSTDYSSYRLLNQFSI